MRQLALAASRPDGSALPGTGNGAPSARRVLVDLGLLAPDNIITPKGSDTLALARASGW